MKINIASNEIIHFIGIGGIGMSGLAQIMKNMGSTQTTSTILLRLLERPKTAHKVIFITIIQTQSL